jgi:hypothetical protein
MLKKIINTKTVMMPRSTTRKDDNWCYPLHCAFAAHQDETIVLFKLDEEILLSLTL